MPNNLKTIFIYSIRILTRQWQRFVLPFISLTFTALIVLTVLLFTNSSSQLLLDKNKELIGGDVSIENNFPLSQENLEKVVPKNITLKSSSKFDFSGLLTFNNFSVPVSLVVVDESYPLYGEVLIKDSKYTYPNSNNIYLDQNGADKLKARVGDKITFANTEFTLAGILDKDSGQIFGSFRFLPKAILSKEGLQKTNLDTSLLRAEYTYNFLLNNSSVENRQTILENAKDLNTRVDIAGITRSGFIDGLATVQQFLILAVLLSCILSAVNVYTGVLYLLNLMRKSFAIMLALGYSKKKLGITIFLSIFYILISATLLGSVLAVILFYFVKKSILTNFALELPSIGLWFPFLLTLAVTLSVSLASFIPSLKSLLSLSPKILLSNGEDLKNKNILFNLVVITISTLLPLVLIAIFLLNSFTYGFLSIGIIAVLYVILSGAFYFLISLIYKSRSKFSFLFRSIIAQKKEDGLFGVVSLTSLYIALSSLALLVLLQSTLTNFLQADLGRRLPSVYVIDVQKSQVQELKSKFEAVSLFPNVGARIISIDDKKIQEALASGDKNVDREFGREYNLTYRKDLLPTEKITDGKWLTGQSGEVSVDKQFAKRANIQLGSILNFSIQGLEVKVTVTSLRETDSRSGLPFFFFVLNPNDLEKFPATFFGYSYLDSAQKNELTAYLAKTFPNVSIIDTTEVVSFAEGIISGLVVIVFIISVPPLVLALFLIVTLIISSFAARRKTSAQLMAIGANKKFTQKLYYLETISTTVISSLLGYLTAVIATILITKYFLKLKSYDLFDFELIVAFLSIIILIIITSYITYKSDKRPLRELLTHEDN